MRQRVYLNNNWYFSENFHQDMVHETYDYRHMEKVRIPHTCKETPFHYFDEQIYQMVSGYIRTLEVPMEWKGKCCFLTFEGIAHECEIYLNGKLIGSHHCGYTAFTVDISKYLLYGEENIITVKVDSWETLNIPLFGYVIDYMTYGGIYRDVYMEVCERAHIEDIYIHSNIDTEITLTSEISLANITEQMEIHQYIRLKGADKYVSILKMFCKTKTDVIHGIKEKNVIESIVKDVKLWDIDAPVLYEIKTRLLKGKQVLDEKVVIHGFRKAEFRTDGFYLNHKKVKIRGLNRHQSFPYVGYAMPTSMQVFDADILKKELGLNAVRTSHYPQSQYFMERCDELGLLVFTEMPGWQHIGDEKWKEQATVNVKDMVLQYRNHPSIILWGVRINESKDDNEFYRKTNEVARTLDPYRQTAGVRAHKKSNLLEDVYTYNDFLHDGKSHGCERKKRVTSDMKKPYLVTEYNGHMYPTKAFDCEEHRVEHAMRHANVLNAIAKEKDIAGSFAWCMTDYNTHKDFGSGDRICYHGVMDMFRNPKLAADVYACQQHEMDILSLSSSMDIGEHPGCNRGKTWIYSNADSVRMYKNERYIKEYSRMNSPYTHMEHGPILIDDFIGNAIEEGENFTKKQGEDIKKALNYVALHGLSNLPKKIIFIALKMMTVYGMKPNQTVELYNRYIGDWGGTSTVYRFEAIKNGKVVKTIVKEAMKKMHLDITTSCVDLIEEHSYDVASVRIRMLDENNNLLHFYNEPVQLSVEGPIEIIGAKVVSLKGGMCGTYIKTKGTTGKGILTIRNSQAEEVKIIFHVSTSII